MALLPVPQIKRRPLWQKEQGDVCLLAFDAVVRPGQAWSTRPSLGDASIALLSEQPTDGKWVCGIAWQEFLSAQGHNPWECMHLSIRIGPLASGESKTIRGKIYLFEGNKDKLLQRYHDDFGDE